jgi:hypothetical protein
VESGERQESKIELAGPYLVGPAFSPDGKYLACIGGLGFLSNDVYIARVIGGKPRALTSLHSVMNGVAWTGLVTLWRVPFSGGEPEQSGIAADDAIQPTIAAHGNRLAFQRYSINTNLWKAPLCIGSLAASSNDCGH